MSEKPDCFSECEHGDCSTEEADDDYKEYCQFCGHICLPCDRRKFHETMDRYAKRKEVIT